MEHYYLNYKDNVCIGSSRAILINDEIECREVTKQEYEEYQGQQEEKRQKIEKITNQIKDKKELLQNYKEDIEQVELFDMKREDYENKKELCKNLVLELRELEKELRDKFGG